MKQGKWSILVTAAVLLVHTVQASEKQEPALKDVFAGKFRIGTALNAEHIRGRIPSDTALVLKHCNTITAENEMKWERIHPNPNEFSFELADKFVEFGQKNNMFIVGHTLVWHSQTPRWVFQNPEGGPANRQLLLQRMKEHIETVVGRYKGRVHAWDVVNEAIEADGSMRKSPWLQIIGPDYIARAFEFAHAADPEAELYYNDYDEWKPGKRQTIVSLVNELREKGIRIDGIGMQGHWGLDYPELEEAEKSIETFAALGLKVMITELDVTVLPHPSRQTGADISQNYELRRELNPWPDGLPDEMQEKLAKRYADIFALFCKHADKIDRVTFWNVHDGNSWRNNWPVRGRSDYPLLFDRQGKPKPAFYAVVKVAEECK
ncbi:MAG: endo-1,4-beta-xylanase [Anaerohalosphaeraceae bacterium]